MKRNMGVWMRVFDRVSNVVEKKKKKLEGLNVKNIQNFLKKSQFENIILTKNNGWDIENNGCYFKNT